MRLRDLAFVVLAAGLLWAGTARASSEWINMTYTGDDPTRTGVVNKAGPGQTPYDVYVGQSNFQIDLHSGAPLYGTDYNGATTPSLGPASRIVTDSAAANYTISGYCIDTHHWISKNTHATFSIVSLAEALKAFYPDDTQATLRGTKAADISRLWKQHIVDSHDTTTADGAAAFAASVWEIVNETTGTYNVSWDSTAKGSFYVHPDGGLTWDHTANTWLGNLGSGDAADIMALVPTDLSIQRFAVLVPAVVPEPFTMLTAFLAIGSLGVYVRKHTTRTVKAA